VLVKFDTSYAYGEKETQWIRLSRRIANLTSSDAKHFLLAVVGVEDYGEKRNDDLRARFGIRTEDFPAFRLFPKNAAAPIAYEGSVDVDGLSAFIAREAGLWIGLPGCLKEFDALARGYTALPAGESQKRREAAAELRAALTGEADVKAASYYIRTMEKIHEKGSGYAAGEAGRIERILGSKITAEAKADLQRRLNVLQAFRTA